MKEKINMEDRSRMYSKCIVEYAGIPVYVQSINDDDSITVKCLETQECHNVVFDLDLLRAPADRLGYVNLPSVAVYAYRMAVRRMKVGISTENLKIEKDDFVRIAHQRSEISDLMRNIDKKELFDTLKGRYPSLEEAIDMFTENRNLVAFDRQFAVDNKLNIYYRGSVVGSIGKNQRKVVEGITWKKAYEHLKDVVGLRLSLSR